MAPTITTGTSEARHAHYRQVVDLLIITIYLTHTNVWESMGNLAI